MEIDEELNRMMSKILAHLQICRERVDQEFDGSGYDAAFFDVEITLKVKFGDLVVGVCDEWEAMT